MSAYITLDDLKGKLPASQIVDALDDDRDGEIDAAVLTQLLNEASTAVDGYLEGRYTTPLTAEMFTTGRIPAAIVEAAKLIALKVICGRRGIADENFPFRDELKRSLDWLEQIREGKLSLAGFDEAVESPASTVLAVTSPMATEETTS